MSVELDKPFESTTHVRCMICGIKTKHYVFMSIDRCKFCNSKFIYICVTRNNMFTIISPPVGEPKDFMYEYPNE